MIEEPAFPQTMIEGPQGMTSAWDGYGTGGISIRDYFAGQAMIQLTHRQHSVTDYPDIAMRAYMIADKMCAERRRLMNLEGHTL